MLACCCPCSPPHSPPNHLRRFLVQSVTLRPPSVLSFFLQEKRSYLAEAEEQQQGAALLVLRRFVEVLSAGHGTAEGDAMDAGAACTVGQRWGFARRVPQGCGVQLSSDLQCLLFLNMQPACAGHATPACPQASPPCHPLPESPPSSLPCTQT